MSNNLQLCDYRDGCNNIAIWRYMPINGGDYCEEHVPRGCSCNVDPDTGLMDKDEQGRLLPCCEYEYYENGWKSG